MTARRVAPHRRAAPLPAVVAFVIAALLGSHPLYTQGNPSRIGPARAPTGLRQAGEALPDGEPFASERPRSTPTRSPVERRRASELIQVQEAPKVFAQLLERMTPETARIVVSLSKQRAYLISDDRVVIDTPVSTGKRAGWTPTGDFTILQKSRDHRSNIYGSYVDSKGRVVRGGISARIDAAPSGTRFVGTPMQHFMRITWTGIGLHEGELPGYPASHGCIRLPGHIAEMIFSKVTIGTPVSVIP